MVKAGVRGLPGIRRKGPHRAAAWLVELAADTLFKYSAHEDGRTPRERWWKGKKATQDTTECGEKLHLKLNQGAKGWARS